MVYLREPLTGSVDDETKISYHAGAIRQE